VEAEDDAYRRHDGTRGAAGRHGVPSIEVAAIRAAVPARPDRSIAADVRIRSGVEVTVAALRRSYRDAVRLAAREEILAELADDVVTAQLHADTARFHHGSAHAYAKALDLLFGEGLNVAEDKQAARTATREADLAPMRCQRRQYRTFESERL
jgi:hypothetical protein